MTQQPEEMSDAIAAFLQDMRASVGAALESQVGVSPSHHVEAHSSDVELRAQIEQLQADLARTREELRAEREKHAQTRDLLRLALRPTAPDVCVEGTPSPLRRRAATPSKTAPEAPGFVKAKPAEAAMTLSPRHMVSSAAVMKAFARVVAQTTPRARTPQRSGGKQLFDDPAAAPSGRTRQGMRLTAPSSNNGEHSFAFGSRCSRFQNIALCGHHAVYVNDHNAVQELTREQAAAIATELQRKRLITPTKTSPTSRGAEPSPIFTGIVRASPLAAAQLRSPELSAWVKSFNASSSS